MYNNCSKKYNYLSKQLEEVQQKTGLTPAEIMHSYYIENRGRNSLDALISFIERLSSDYDRTVKEATNQFHKSNSSKKTPQKDRFKYYRCYMGQPKHSIWKVKTVTHYAHSARLAYQPELYAYCNPEDRRRSYEYYLWNYKLTRLSTGWKSQHRNKHQYEKRAQFHFSTNLLPFKEVSKTMPYNKQYESDFSPDEIDAMLYDDFLKNIV